jgi:diguanylate cyclase (GGDEF)-like protein/PAS domain S-box-containing protein
LSTPTGELAEKLRAKEEEVALLQMQMEKALERANTLFLKAELSSIELLQIFNASHDAIWIVDRNEMVLRVNRSFLEILDLPKEEVVGRKCREILPLKELCGSPRCPLRRVLGGESRVTTDLETTLAGKERAFILAASPYRDIGGETVGAIASFKDISDRLRAEKLLREANAELERLATVDGLTGLANRRRFDASLDLEWRRGRREGQPLSLILCDVDHFKLYNDSYGHVLGDACLVRVGQALRDQARRPADVVARYGGEEFVFVLPNTPPEGALVVAELARKRVVELGIEHRSSPVDPHVTLSLGVAGLVPCTELAPEQLTQKADEALYRAKQGGRNRSVL